MRTLNSAASSPSVARVPTSPWHSPVPYLFGGLAAMLGLIAFALLILACSYWKLSGHMDNNEGDERDLESGEEKSGDGKKPAYPVYEEKIVVIMAGDQKPTYLATPMSSRASSFGNTSTCSSSSSYQQSEKSEKSDEKDKDLQMTNEVEEQTQNRPTQTSQDQDEQRENIETENTQT